MCAFLKNIKKIIGSLEKHISQFTGLVIRDAAGSSTGGALSESLNFAYLIRAHPRHPRNLCSKSFATVYINQIELTVSGLLFPAAMALELGKGYIVSMVIWVYEIVFIKTKGTRMTQIQRIRADLWF